MGYPGLDGHTHGQIGLWRILLGLRRIAVMDKLTVHEAAQRLGLTRDAVYKRIQRNQIAWDKDPDGKVYVYVDEANTATDDYVDTVQTEKDVLIAALRDEVEAWREESRRKDEIIARMNQTFANMTEAMRALTAATTEASSESRESPLRHSKDAKGTEGRDRGRKPFWAFWIRD